jgi:hypothetical protein
MPVGIERIPVSGFSGRIEQIRVHKIREIRSHNLLTEVPYIEDALHEYNSSNLATNVAWFTDCQVVRYNAEML